MWMNRIWIVNYRLFLNFQRLNLREEIRREAEKELKESGIAFSCQALLLRVLGCPNSISACRKCQYLVGLSQTKNGR